MQFLTTKIFYLEKGITRQLFQPSLLPPWAILGFKMVQINRQNNIYQLTFYISGEMVALFNVQNLITVFLHTTYFFNQAPIVLLLERHEFEKNWVTKPNRRLIEPSLKFLGFN